MKKQDVPGILKSKLNDSAIPASVSAIYIYGSILKGKLRADSDIDVAMLSRGGIDVMKRFELMADVEGILTTLLRELGFRQEVSVLDLRGDYVSLSLQYSVVTEGELVFERDTLERAEFENAVKRDYFDFVPYLRFLREAKHGSLSQKI